MNRALITGIAIAGVAGSGGAAFAGMASGPEHTPPTTPAIAGVVGGRTHEARTISYQVGPAGTVTLTVADDVLTVTATSAGAGWSVLGSNGPGAHVDVQFSDALQVVTFSADVHDGEVTVTLASAPMPEAATTTAPLAPIEVTVIPVAQPAPLPATTAPHHSETTAQQQPAGTAPSTPSHAATTSPSSYEEEDDHESDEHESESDEHESESDHDDD